ncbi:hypothetical protein [Pontibacter sp. HJ8]
MNRQDRERDDYGRYEGYRNDEHYHAASNLTNQFEQQYRRGRGHDEEDRYQPTRSYHEGSSGGDYEENMRDRGSYRGQSWDQGYERNQNRTYSGNLDRERDRYSNYQDDYRSYPNVDRSDRDRFQGRRSNIEQGNVAQGYGISNYEGTSDRYNTLNSDQNRSGRGEQSYYSGSRGSYSGSRSGGGMGESFPSSHHGVPDTTHGLRNFSDREGSGMGSSYGGSNYGGGTGYAGGNRGGSFGNSSYGSSSGNYGGSGSMGGGSSYGGRSSGSNRGSSSHNTDRGTNESGGY